MTPARGTVHVRATIEGPDGTLVTLVKPSAFTAVYVATGAVVSSAVGLSGSPVAVKGEWVSVRVAFTFADSGYFEGTTAASNFFSVTATGAELSVSPVSYDGTSRTAVLVDVRATGPFTLTFVSIAGTTLDASVDASSVVEWPAEPASTGVTVVDSAPLVGTTTRATVQFTTGSSGSSGLSAPALSQFTVSVPSKPTTVAGSAVSFDVDVVGRAALSVVVTLAACGVTRDYTVGILAANAAYDFPTTMTVTGTPCARR